MSFSSLITLVLAVLLWLGPSISRATANDAATVITNATQFLEYLKQNPENISADFFKAEVTVTALVTQKHSFRRVPKLIGIPLKPVTCEIEKDNEGTVSFSKVSKFKAKLVITFLAPESGEKCVYETSEITLYEEYGCSVYGCKTEVIAPEDFIKWLDKEMFNWLELKITSIPPTPPNPGKIIKIPAPKSHNPVNPASRGDD